MCGFFRIFVADSEGKRAMLRSNPERLNQGTSKCNPHRYITAMGVFFEMLLQCSPMKASVEVLRLSKAVSLAMAFSAILFINVYIFFYIN